MKKLLQRFILTTLGVAALVGCNSPEPDPGPAGPFTLKAETKIVNLTASIGEKVVKVTATNPEWAAAVIDAASHSWLAVQAATISSVSNVIVKAVQINQDLGPRTGKVRIYSKNGVASDTITVTQLGTAPAILVDITDVVKVPYMSGVQVVNVTTNAPYVVEIDEQCTWITEENKSKAMVTYKHNFAYVQNKSIPRTGTIVIRTEGIDPEIRKEVKISQEGAGGPVVVPVDTLYRPSAARVSDYQNGAGPEKIIDGDYETFYHSQWSLDKPVDFPKWVEVDVPAAAKSLDYMVVYPRGGNGDWGQVEVSYNTQTNASWVKIADVNFQKSGNNRPIFFDAPIVGAKTFRLSIKDGSNNNSTCREIEFFKYNNNDPQAEAIKKVFQTPACMALKPEVTDADIEKLPSLMQIIAVALREGTYNGDFRMGTYKAHSSPEYWAGKLKTKKLGQADNPTGIWAKQGEKITVLVGETWGNQIQLFSCDANAGAHGDNYLLKTGVNEITIKNDGLFYVKYYLNDITVASAKPIEVHIPEGHGYVNGYFDLEKDKTDAEYARLYKLSKTPFRMFDIVGKYAHLIYSRGYIPESKIIAGLGWYDKMCFWDWEIMGMDKLHKEGKINHRHVFISSDNTEVYMNASDYRTQYGQGTLNERLQENTMFRTRDLMWGPAHEVGHQLQYSINFNGMTEISNNLFSNLFTYKSNQGNKTRGAGVQNAIDSGFMKKIVYIGGKAVAMNQTPFVLTSYAQGVLMRLYWQLYVYYNICEKNPNFWPNVFALMRDADIHEFSNPQQTTIELYKVFCDAAGEDLTEFFSHWGWFEPFTAEVDDYGKRTHTLTKAMVDAAQAAVKAKNYPKAGPIEYIEDREVMDKEDSGISNTKGDTGYYTFYKENAKIKSTIAVAKNANTFAVTNWQGAAAFEVWDGGKITFKTVKATFTVDAQYLTPTAKLCAVQVDGQRIEIWPKAM